MTRRKQLAILATVVLLGVGAIVGTAAVGPSVDNLFEQGDQVDGPEATADGVFLAPADTHEGDTYANLDNDELELTIEDLNPDAEFVLDEVFVVGYSGDELARVGFDIENVDNVEFYLVDHDAEDPDGAEVVDLDLFEGDGITADPIATEREDLDDAGIEFEPGEQAAVGMVIETDADEPNIDNENVVEVIADVANADFDIVDVELDGIQADDNELLVVEHSETLNVDVDVRNTGTAEAEADRSVTLRLDDSLLDQVEFENIAPGEERTATFESDPVEDHIGIQFKLEAEVYDTDDFGEGDSQEDKREIPVRVTTDAEYEFAVPNDGETYALGFPADVDAESYDDVFVEVDGAAEVYAFDPTTDEFEQVDFEETAPEALDALVVSTAGEGDGMIDIEIVFEEETPPAATTDLDEGLNFVPAAEFGYADTVVPAASTADLSQVSDPYEAPQSDELVQPDSFAGTHALGSGDDPSLDPFKGYFVVADESGQYVASVDAAEHRFDVETGLDALAVQELSTDEVSADDDEVAVEVVFRAAQTEAYGFSAYDALESSDAYLVAESGGDEVATKDISDDGVHEIDLSPSTDVLQNEDFVLKLYESEDEDVLLAETTTTVTG